MQIQEQKELWLERLTWLTPMLETVNDALDTINKAQKLNSEALMEITGLNEFHYNDCLTQLRAITGKSTGSNAKAIGAFVENMQVTNTGEIYSVRMFIPVDDSDIPTLTISNNKNQNNEYPHD